jgi:hypothetical protein
MSKIIQIWRGGVLLAVPLFFSNPSHAIEPAFPYVFDGGRLSVKSSPEELVESRATLLHVDERHIPKSMDGGVLFDGEVIRQLPSDKFGQPIWLVKPLHFWRGKKEVRGGTIEVVSPTTQAGGVVLSPSRKYRIFTVNLEGRFFIWKAVVVELQK